MSFVIAGNEAQEFHWKGFGFKLHVPMSALKSGVRDCTIHVKAFLPNNYLELPQNTQFVSAIYHISMSSPNTLRKAVDIEIEHCCKLVEANQEMPWFVTSTSALWESPSFSYIDGGNFSNENTYGRIVLHHFSWFAIMWQWFKSLSVRYCIKVYQKSVSLTMKYIHFILIKNLEVHLQVIVTPTLSLQREVCCYYYPFLQAIENRYERQNELCGCEATFHNDSDQVLLDIDKDGATTEEGWHIRPLMDPPLVKFIRKPVDIGLPFFLAFLCYMEVQLT